MELFKSISQCGKSILLAIVVSSSVMAAPATNPSTSKSVWEISYNLEHQKKYAEAASAIKPILDKSPQNEFALIRMGWLAYLQAKYNVSEDYYHKALDMNTDSIDARLGLTLPLMAQLRWKEAAIYANQVISMSAWGYVAHIRLMACESGLMQWETLENHASEFIKRYPSDVSGFLYLARAQAMLGKKEKAIQNYKETLERVPTNAEAIKYLKDHIR